MAVLDILLGDQDKISDIKLDWMDVIIRDIPFDSVGCWRVRVSWMSLCISLEKFGIESALTRS